MLEPYQNELRPGEFHPMAPSAFQFIKSQGATRLLALSEALASTALSNAEGSRLAAICHGTLDRILTGQRVSDRYVLGLAWLLITSPHLTGAQQSSSQ